MPIKSRMIEEKLNQVLNRKLQLETELEAARLDLETAQNAVIKGALDTDALVSIQTRINVFEQTLKRFDSSIAELENDLVEQKRIEKRREMFASIKLLDNDAEILGNYFLELYSDVENLSYARFAEMSGLLGKIEGLKAEFNKFVVALVPDVIKLKRLDLPDVQSELDNLLSELQITCKLNVLRSEKIFSSFEYVTDDYHAFKLPEHDLSGWIWLSIRTIEGREERKQRLNLPEAEKTGFLSKIMERIS